MKDKRHLSHDILNALERLQIMHDLIRDKNYQMISLEEIQNDLKETLDKMEKDYQSLINVD